MRRAFILVAALSVWAGACASAPPSPDRQSPPPLPPTNIHYGIGDGNYTGVPFFVLGAYCDAGPTVVRSPARSAEEAHVIVESERPCPTTSAHLLIEENRVDIAGGVGAYAATEPRVTIIECGNELELKPLDLDIPTAATFVHDCATVLRQAGYAGDILTAAVYTIDTNTLPRLKAYRAACPTCGCAIHWYAGDIREWQQQLAAVGCPWIAVTEFGKPSRTAVEDAGQLAYYQDEVPGFWSIGATLIEAYQRASGPCGDTTNLGNFGLWRCDNSPKPAWTYWQSLLRR